MEDRSIEDRLQRIQERMQAAANAEKGGDEVTSALNDSDPKAAIIPFPDWDNGIEPFANWMKEWEQWAKHWDNKINEPISDWTHYA